MKIEIPTPLLDEKTVAPLIGKSVAWLQRKRWEGGGIPYRKLGRHVRYSHADVMAWINQHPLQQSTSEVTHQGQPNGEDVRS